MFIFILAQVKNGRFGKFSISNPKFNLAKIVINENLSYRLFSDFGSGNKNVYNDMLGEVLS